MRRTPSNLNPIDYLTARKFPLATASIAALKIKDSQLAARHREAVRAAEEYKKELRLKSPAEIADLVQEERQKEADEAATRAQKQEEAHFFNRPAATADFNLWSRTAYWTLEEAVALSFGKSPKVVNWSAIKSFSSVSPFVRRYAEVLDLATRAKKIGQLYDTVLPGFFIGWARRYDLDFPQELEAMVKARGRQIGDWKTLYDDEVAAHAKTRDAFKVETEKLFEWFKEQQLQLSAQYRQKIEAQERQISDLAAQLAARPPVQPEKPLPTRERESLLKIIIGLAMEELGYDPAQARSPIPGEISGILQRRGMNLSDDTVRKYLQEARELLP